MANTEQASLQTAPIEFDRNKVLKEIHDIGWGKPWPTKPCTIDRREILLNETDNGGGHKEMCVDYADNSDIPATETFKCLLNVDLLQTALDLAPTQQLQAIIVLREYERLREALENDSKEWYFLVTGQPGTGNTLYILYLLLYRLGKKLPAAVQFLATKYIFFDAKGGSLRSTISRPSERLPRGCWCLCDGNAFVKYPCQHFMQSELRAFLVTSASPETYKKWRNQTDATTVVKALPRTVEMAAIAKMHGFQPCDAVSVSQRWGPNIHTIFAILRDRRKEKVFLDRAARRIYQDPPRMVGSGLNKPVDGVFEGTSLTWLQKFLNLL